MMRTLLVSAALASLLLAGGCGPVVIGTTAAKLLDQERVNVLNNSYAMADILSERSSRQISKSDRLSVRDLQDISDVNRKDLFGEPVKTQQYPALGRTLAEQMRVRFVQLGHNVVDASSIGQQRNDGAEVSGTYQIVDKKLFVTLRMRNLKNDTLITVHEYSLPVTYDLKRVMTPDREILPPLVSPAE